MAELEDENEQLQRVKNTCTLAATFLRKLHTSENGTRCTDKVLAETAAAT